MARRISTERGDYLPQLAAGIRARAAWLAGGFPGIGNPRSDALDRGEPFPLTGLDVWTALFAIDRPAADVFKARYRAPRPSTDEPAFEYDPRTGVLTRGVDA